MINLSMLILQAVIGTVPAPSPSPPPLPVVTSQSSMPIAQTGPVLWRNISAGMTAAQLRSLYPQGPSVAYKNDRTVLADVQIIEGCKAKVNIMHGTGFVKEIVMRGEGSLGGRCSAKIIAALSGKYGEPLDKESTGGSILAREGKNYVWSQNGVTMQFKRYTNGALGGGGLGAASWEMRYSTTAGNIDL